MHKYLLGLSSFNYKFISGILFNKFKDCFDNMFFNLLMRSQLETNFVVQIYRLN